MRRFLPAIPPIIAGLILAGAFFVSRSDSVARSRAACRTTHDGLSALVTAVGVAVEAPPADGSVQTPAEHARIVKFVVGLQVAVDEAYESCLAGTS